jgi:hypothetical protein
MLKYDRTNKLILSKKTLNELHQMLKKKVLNNYILKNPISNMRAFNTDFDGDEPGNDFASLTPVQLNAFHAIPYQNPSLTAFHTLRQSQLSSIHHIPVQSNTLIPNNPLDDVD